MSRWNPALCCTRCGKPILSDDQVCRWRGQYWPCIPPDDQSVIEADGLQLKTGDRRGCGGPRVMMPEDPYATED